VLDVAADDPVTKSAAMKGKAKVYRSASVRWFAVFFTVVFLWSLDTGITALFGGYGGHTLFEDILGSAAALFGCFGCVWSIWHVGRMGVAAGEQAIVVRNWFRSTTVRWEEIDCFEFGDQMEHLSFWEWLETPSLMPFAVLKGGRHVAMSGLSATRAGPRRSRAKVQGMLDTLNGELSRHAN